MMNKPKALYLHVPFCAHICSYCDFARSKYHSTLVEGWLKRLNQDLVTTITDYSLSTIYLGGGTPTALNEEELEMLFKLLQPYAKQLEEYTIEVNPETLTKEKAILMKKYGINRISLGVQSFDDDMLKIMNRAHTTEDIQQSLAIFHEVGITNISIDLMYRMPSQTMEMWENDLRIACNLPIQHISLYSLTIEENSAFGRQHIVGLDQDDDASMYELAYKILVENGFNRYEFSNFAKEDKQSKHNLVYWHYDDFYGIGCGASGKENGSRYINNFRLDKYIAGEDITEYTQLTKQDEVFEYIMMNIRLVSGISKSAFYERFHVQLDEILQKSIEEGITNNWIVQDDLYIHLSDEGYLLMNEWLVIVLEEISIR